MGLVANLQARIEALERQNANLRTEALNAEAMANYYKTMAVEAIKELEFTQLKLTQIEENAQNYRKY